MLLPSSVARRWRRGARPGPLDTLGPWCPLSAAWGLRGAGESCSKPCPGPMLVPRPPDGESHTGLGLTLPVGDGRQGSTELTSVPLYRGGD